MFSKFEMFNKIFNNKNNKNICEFINYLIYNNKFITKTKPIHNEWLDLDIFYPYLYRHSHLISDVIHHHNFIALNIKQNKIDIKQNNIKQSEISIKPITNTMYSFIKTFNNSSTCTFIPINDLNTYFKDNFKSNSENDYNNDLKNGSENNFKNDNKQEKYLLKQLIDPTVKYSNKYTIRIKYMKNLLNTFHQQPESFQQTNLKNYEYYKQYYQEILNLSSLNKINQLFIDKINKQFKVDNRINIFYPIFIPQIVTNPSNTDLSTNLSNTNLTNIDKSSNEMTVNNNLYIILFQITKQLIIIDIFDISTHHDNHIFIDLSTLNDLNNLENVILNHLNDYFHESQFTNLYKYFINLSTLKSLINTLLAKYAINNL